MRDLVRDPDRTELANDVFLALDPLMHEHALARMLSHREGRRVYDERPSLASCLCDRERLAATPEGSFGRAYLEHLDRYGLNPLKLIELYHDTVESRDEDPDVRWMAERSQLCHDLWHVLTGYGADRAGESALLLFSLAQAPGFGNALLSFGANQRMTGEWGLRWIPYAWRAWRRGRNAVCLNALPYERLLALPLEEARATAGIEAPEVAHRGGVRCSSDS